MAMTQKDRPQAASGDPNPDRDTAGYYRWLFLLVPGAFIGAREARRDGRDDVAKKMVKIGVALFIGFLLFFGFIAYRISQSTIEALEGLDQPLAEEGTPSYGSQPSSAPQLDVPPDLDQPRLQQQLEACRAAGGAGLATGTASDTFTEAIASYHHALDQAYSNSNETLLLCAYYDPPGHDAYAFHHKRILDLAVSGQVDESVSVALDPIQLSQTTNPPSRTGCFRYQAGDTVGAVYESTLVLVDGFWLLERHDRDPVSSPCA
ncbi:hypothetical protein KY386_03740 [Candidatus Parcubacteria bacterium]|nr:hypothetical protein [Candidatus Parcubacteria bacterium]